MRRPDRSTITARGAARLIVLGLVVVVVVAGPVARLADPADFPTIGVAWWWALQTATTVGYGDVVPHSVLGRAVGALLMVESTAFVAVVTAVATSMLVERLRDRARPDPLPQQLAEVLERLERIERSLRDRDAD